MGAGGSSEATLEGLNPWTRYHVQIQAYNSIGAGPWSSSIAAQTAESGTNSFLYVRLQRRVVSGTLAECNQTDG